MHTTACLHTLSLTHTPTHKHTHTRTHTPTRTHTQKHAYTRAHTHTHTGVLACNNVIIVLEILELLVGSDGCCSLSLLRPKLTTGTDGVPPFVADCMKECWSEDPTPRPDFKTVRRLLKPLQKGM